MTAESRTPSLCKHLACGAAVAVVCAVSLFRTDLPMIATPSGQWDFEAYYYAVKTYDAGGNPWNNDEMCQTAGHWVHYFFYPHHTLAFFRLFALGDLATGKALFLAVKLACATALCVLWTTCFVRPGARGWFIAFLAVGFNTALARDLVCGNVSLFEQSLIWFGVYALLRGRPWLFCAFILLAAQFKILPIGLLGLVLLTDTPRKWRCFAAGVASAGLIAGAVYLSDPRAAALFWHASRELGAADLGGIYNPSSLPLAREISAAMLERTTDTDVVFARSVGWWTYGVFVVVIIACFSWCAVKRGVCTAVPGGACGAEAADYRPMIYLALLTYGLLNPRMKDYTCVLLLVPVFETMREGLRRWGKTTLSSEPTADEITGQGPGPPLHANVLCAGAWPRHVRHVMIVAVAALAIPGLDLLWPYRSLLLTGWAWLIGMGADDERLSPPASSCPCRPSAWPARAGGASTWR